MPGVREGKAVFFMDLTKTIPQLLVSIASRRARIRLRMFIPTTEMCMRTCRNVGRLSKLAAFIVNFGEPGKKILPAIHSSSRGEQPRKCTLR
jgi:hypothetical protein